MKKATFFATIIFFMAFMGFLRPTAAEAIIIIETHTGPFSIVTRTQAAQVHIVNNSPHADTMCQVEVKFSDRSYNVIDRVMMTLRGNSKKTYDFDPAAFGQPGGRNQYVAQVIVSGKNKRECNITMTAKVYDMASGETIAVYDFKEELPPNRN